MATVTRNIDARPVRSKQAESSAGSLRYDWIVTLALAFFVAGGYLDSWAHTHLGDLETFFTPWHAVLYFGSALVAAIHGVAVWRNVSKGKRFIEAIPKGYRLSVIGVGLFFVGGVLDMFWHELVGIEVNMQGMVSPPHLMLVVASAMVYSGPLMAMWQRPTPKQITWVEYGPALLSALYTLALILLVMQYNSVIANPNLITQPYGAEFMNLPDFMALNGVLMPTVLMMGFILMLMKRWKTLPFGSMMLIIMGITMLLGLVRFRYVVGFEMMMVCAFLSGLLADLLLVKLNPAKNLGWQMVAFAAGVPFVYYLLYFVAVTIPNGLTWTIHVWLGAAVLAGIAGTMTSWLVFQPKMPQESS